MKFLIIGAGWYGCHIAQYLIEKGHSIDIIDKTNKIFEGSSSKNQNRLHLGFHYPRSSSTIIECMNGYKQFCTIYPDLLYEFNMNLYFISKYNSHIDINQYLKVYNIYDISYSIINQSSLPITINNIEYPTIAVNERYINPFKSQEYFNNALNKYLYKIDDATIFNSIHSIKAHIGSEYDYIINCTFNHLEPIDFECYELFLTLIYKIDTPDIFAYTLMDGPFFSIYPYDIEQKLYTVTSVIHGILYRGDIAEYNYSDDIIHSRRQLIDQQILEYIPTWSQIGKYVRYFTSWKTKHNTDTDDRSVRHKMCSNIITFYGGKITGIFEAEKILEDILKESAL